MRADRARCRGAVCALALFGCGSAGAPPGDTAPSCWQEAAPAAPAQPSFSLLGELPLASNGETAPLTVPLPSGGDTVVLRISDPTGAPACVQLDSVADPGGVPWVTSAAGDWGPFCVDCPQRVSVGIGYGLYVLPSNDRPPPWPASLQIVAGARDCATLLPGPPSPPARLRVEGLFPTAVAPSRAGVVALGLAFLRQSPLADEATRQAVLPETLRLVNELFAPGALQVVVARTRVVDTATGTIELSRGDDGPLDALFGQVLTGGGCDAPPDDGWVPVVFAGCLRVVDPVQATTSEPDGMTPGIPDGFPPAGRAHGVYLKGQSCQAGMAPIDWSPSMLAKLLAHELGHYLGLYHAVEADGTVDQLADTDASNLMVYDPLTVAAPTFSASQFQVMRRHPVIRWSPAD
jgi:hypothetical protein